MQMKQIPVGEAAGHVLCHDMTQIIPGKFKGARFKKGHVVREEDIPVLKSMGKENLYVLELTDGDLHEDEAAAALAALCGGDEFARSDPSEGKIELTALHDGVLIVDTARLNRVNAVPELMIATRRGNRPVKAGDKICGTRVIPLVIGKERIDEARKAAGDEPLMKILPYKLSSAAVIATGGEVASGLIEDAFTPVLKKKLGDYGISVTDYATPGDQTDKITEAILAAREKKPDLIICTAGMSVDPDDNTPGAIKRSGAEVVTYGAPVLPGAMFMLGYYSDGVPVMGLPGCVMYAGATIFDLVLPRIAAGVKLKKEDFTVMGEGGMCLGCKPCTFPVCPFGR